MMRLAAVASALACAAAAKTGLFGLDPQQGLISIAANGTTTLIGQEHPTLLQAQQLSALDEQHGVLYFIGYDTGSKAPKFVGLSLVDGSIVSSVPVPFSDEAFIGVGQAMAWEPSSKQLLAAGQQADQTHIVGLVDPVSGAWTQLAQHASSWIDVLGGGAVYCSGYFLYQLANNSGIYTFALNVATKEVAISTTGLDTQDCDYATGLVYGLSVAVDNGKLLRTIGSFDPAKLEAGVTTLGSVPAYTIESGGEAAIDTASRSIYWIGQKTGAPDNAPFYLIRNSLVNASLLSAAPLCTDDAACPWSLQYLNAKF